jgi:hypothetical protein
MSPYDQALCFLAFVGVVMMAVALFVVRRLDRLEREIERERHPTE